jgi:CPA2 family monovalent cation:H+ antiporter-2
VISQVGEFSFVIFTQATNSNLLSKYDGQLLTLAVIISMVLTPFILNNIQFLANLLFKEPTVLRERAIVSTGYKNHIIICGYGPVGRILAIKFKAKNLTYVILEHDVKVVDKAIARGEKSIFLANAAQKGVLEHFSIKESSSIIVAIGNEHQLRLICENIDSFDADINSVVKVKNNSEEEIIRNLNVKHIINSRDTISDILAQRVLECKI